MTTNKIILVDVDDTLLKWREGFIAYAASKGKHPVNGHESYFMMDQAFGISRVDGDDLVSEFNGGHWSFGALQALKDAKEVLVNLNKNHGYRFVAVSSCMSAEISVALRKANLFHSFGDIFDDVFCLDREEKKEDYLSRYKPTVWVDDRIEQANAGIKTGHQTFLLNRPWNINDPVHKKVIRCNDWFEIEKYILKEE